MKQMQSVKEEKIRTAFGGGGSGLNGERVCSIQIGAFSLLEFKVLHRGMGEGERQL